MGHFVVTGCLGFIGSNLVRSLLNSGDNTVVGLDNVSSGQLGNISDFKDNSKWRFVEGDIRDLSVCHEVCRSADFVLHQAALGSVPESFENPILYNENNCIGTLNLMIAGRDANVKRFIYASSASVYGDSPELPKLESMVLNPKSPYAISKSTCEYYGKMMYETYGLPTVGLRYFNVFGPYQNPMSQYAAVIPQFITRYLAHEAPTIFGDGEQTRDFVSIKDVVAANLKACTAGERVCGKAYNIGSGVGTSLNALAAEIKAIVGSKLSPVYASERTGDIRHSVAGIENAKVELELNEFVSLRAGLEETIEWYRKKRG